MESLVNVLQVAVNDSTFQYSDRGQISANRLPELFEARKWNHRETYSPGRIKVVTSNKAMGKLVESLKPVLDPFVQPESDRIGNGLHFLTGGLSSMACPTVPEFAQLMVRGAAHLGSGYVAELVSGWAAGAPLCYKANFLLDGIKIDQPIELENGVRLLRLPRSFDRFPVGFPHIPTSLPEWRNKELPGATVLSIDCYIFPVLFKPDEGEALTFDAFDEMRKKFTYSSASMVVPGFSPDSFCKALSQPRDWQVSCNFWWDDVGELQAFTRVGSSGCSWREATPLQRTLFTKSDVRAAIGSHFPKSGKDSRKRSLDVAISRWIRAKRTTSILDALIELRIAFEALYEIEGNTEKRFRVATYAAWHLGVDVEERLKCREVVSGLYGEASKVLHASGSKRIRDRPKLIAQALNYCYRGIMKRRKEDGQVKWDELSMGAGLEGAGQA